MRICFVHIPGVGDQEQLDFLGNILLRTKEVLGKHAEVHFLYYGNCESTNLIEQNIFLHRHSDRGVMRAGLVPGHVRSLCKRKKIDIVLNLSDHYFFFLVAFGAKLAGAKAVARVAGLIQQSAELPIRRRVFKAIGRLCERISLILADQTICLSESLRNLLVERGNNPEKIVVVPQGVNLDLFSKRDVADIDKRPERLVFVGRVTRNKGIEDCITAFLNLKSDYPALTLHIYGDGPDKEEMLRTYGSQDSGICYHGFVKRDNLPAAYLSNDILVLPSYSEGLPNVVLEAMSCQLPVVAARTGEIPHLLADDRGALVSPGDIADLTHSLARMIDNQVYRRQCVLDAYEFVQAYSNEAVRGKTLDLFKTLAPT